MKRFILIFSLCFVCAFVSVAQPVGYTHKAFAPDGCIVNYLVVFDDTKFFIDVTFESDLSKFTEKPTMMIRTFADDVFKLSGTVMSCDVLTSEVERDGVKKTISAFSSVVRFNIDSSQLETFKNGIAKIRLSTTPYEHEKEFKKDKIGKHLYECYLKEKNKDANF